MTIFLVAHGAWSAGWAWKKMRPLLRAAGHDLFTPTYTGLGERAHLASPAIDLDTHIRDILGVLDMEDLREVALIGHSYGGMVATGVADRARDRIAQLVYLDAFVPKDGQSSFDLQGAETRNRMRELAKTAGEGWRIPPNPMPPDTAEADVAWAAGRRLPQPLKTFEQPLRLTGQAPPPPRTYIYCRRARPDDVFRQFAERAQRESSWRYFEMDASHNPHITVPQELLALLEKIVGSLPGLRFAAFGLRLGNEPSEREEAMNMRWCTGALLALAISTAPAAAAEYRMLTSWDKSNPAVPLLAEGFAKSVEAASKGNIKFVLSGPETVPGFEQLQPVAAGAFHMLFTHGIYHYGQTGLSVGLDAVRGTIEERRASGLFDALDKHYQKIGIKVVAVAISAKTGYAFALKTPVGADGDLKGKKVRGTPTYHPLIRMLGGAPVVLPIPEVYTALEKGVIDGAASPVVGLLGVRWHEVAKYLAQPSFGVTHQLFLMNLATWNRLSDADKKLLLDEGRKIEEVWYREYDRMAEAEIKELIAKGVTVSQLGPSPAKLNEVWSEGVWELAEKKSPAEAKELRQIAKSKGLTD